LQNLRRQLGVPDMTIHNLPPLQTPPHPGTIAKASS
jgi:hypothetical protein